MPLVGDKAAAAHGGDGWLAEGLGTPTEAKNKFQRSDYAIHFLLKSKLLFNKTL